MNEECGIEEDTSSEEEEEDVPPASLSSRSRKQLLKALQPALLDPPKPAVLATYESYQAGGGVQNGEQGKSDSFQLKIQSKLLKRPPVYKDHLLIKTTFYRFPGVYFPYY